MAIQVTKTLVDDIDGSPARETVTFELDGVAYEIDVSAANAAKLRTTLAPYTSKGRRTGGRRTQTPRTN